MQSFAKGTSSVTAALTPEESKKITDNRVLLIASVILPVLFMSVMLLAYLDPMGGMNKVPALVVNLDRGAQIEGTDRNIGQEFCDNLINANAKASDGTVSGFGWSFSPSVEEAVQKLEEGGAYLLLVIPEDFSKSIASAPGDTPVQAHLQVRYNPSLSYNAQEIGSSFLAYAAASLTHDVQSEKLENVFVDIQGASDKFLTLTNAGRDLTDGLIQAKDGAAELADGLGQLQDGSAQLTDGLNEAGLGAYQLAGGAGQLADGVGQLADGLNQLKQGVEDSSSSPEAKALAAALASVGESLKKYGTEMSKENPDAAVAQAYLKTAAQAAKDAAAANKTMGDPLVAYISGGTFSYGSGSSRVTSTELGLIPALEAYAKAQADLEKFEEEELKPLLEDITTIADSLEELGEVGEKTVQDLREYARAVEAYHEARVDYRRSEAAYAVALNGFEAGIVTFDQLKAAWCELCACSKTLEEAEQTLASCREAVSYDLCHKGESGQDEGLIPTLKTMGVAAADLLSRIESLEDVQVLLTQLMDLISAQAKAGAAMAGAAGKCEGYLVGVAVSSEYMGGSMTQLTQAIGEIYAAVAGGSGQDTSLLSGTQSLSQGADALAQGVVSAAEGSNLITINLGKVCQGGYNLAEGLASAAKTSDSLFSALGEGQTQIKDMTTNSEAQTSVLSWPVSVDTDQSSLISNAGTSVAPYYLCAGLWAGSMLAALALRRLRRSPKGSVPGMSESLKNWGILVGVTALQALLGMAIMLAGFGLQVDHLVVFFGMGLLVALCFATLMQLFVGLMGSFGFALAIVLGVLQLAMAGAFFPVESAGLSLLAQIGRFMSLPQAVVGLRVAMRGLWLGQSLWPVAVLAVTTLLALGIYVASPKIISFVKNKMLRELTLAEGGLDA